VCVFRMWVGRYSAHGSLVYGYSAAGHSLGVALHSVSGRLCSRRIPKARGANIFKLVY
jgi:hypothetical protein